MITRGLVVVLCCAWMAVGAAQASVAAPLVVSQIENDIISVIAFQIMKEAYRRLGIDAETEILPNERALHDANNGATDAENIRKAGIEKIYSNLIPVSEPVLNFDVMVFTTGLTFAMNGWDSLRPYSICLLRGMKVAEDGTAGMRQLISSTPEQVIRMLAAGRCDVAVLGRGIWTEIDRLRVGSFRALEPPVATVPLFHYVNRRHADLAPKLAEMLRQMQLDGTIDRVFASETQAIDAARLRNALP